MLFSRFSQHASLEWNLCSFKDASVTHNTRTQTGARNRVSPAIASTHEIRRSPQRSRSRSRRWVRGTLAAVCAGTFLLSASPPASAGAALVHRENTWTEDGLRIQNPSGITWVSGKDASAPGHFLVSDLLHSRFPTTERAFLAPVGHDMSALVSRTGIGFDLQDITRDPSGVAYHPRRHTLFITDDDEVKLYETDLKGRTLNTIDLAALGSSDPEGVTCDPRSGNLFIADGRARRILELSPGGDFISIFKLSDIIGLGAATGIAFDPTTEHLFVVAGRTGALFELTRHGDLVAAYDLVALGAQRPRGLAFAPSSDPGALSDAHSLYVVGDIAGKTPSGCILELHLARRPTKGRLVTELVGDVDGFGFLGHEAGFPNADRDHDGLLESGDQIPGSVIGSETPADNRELGDDAATDVMLVATENRPIVFEHSVPLAGRVPLWARLTLLVADARTVTGARNVITADGARIGEVIGSEQKNLRAGSIATTVLELPPASLRALADGDLRIEIARDPGTGDDDIMIDFSRLEVAVAE